MTKVLALGYRMEVWTIDPDLLVVRMVVLSDAGNANVIIEKQHGGNQSPTPWDQYF